MRRPIVIAAALLLAALIVSGGAMALCPVEPAGPAYTVTDTIAGLRQHPAQWIGRTVAVRGVVTGYGFSLSPIPGSSWYGSVLHDPIPGRGQLFPSQIARQVAGTITMRMRFNAPGTTPTLILQGAGPSRPTLVGTVQAVGIARYVGYLMAMIAARRTNTYRPSPPQPPPRVYRVHLLAPARCPAPLALPCYTAVVR